MTSVLLGLVPPDVAFAGFGSPAVITVAALLVVRGEVERSGVIDALAGRWLGRSAEPLAHLALLTVLGALLSAFMNNVAALALLLPIALTTARRHGYGPGFLLMPLSFATLLGGMVTLIGTPPNLLVSTFRAEAVGARFELFDFAPMGLVLTAAGTTYLILFGHRFLRRESPSASGGRFRVRDYVTELEIGAGSPLIGRQVEHYEIERDLRVSGIVRDGRRVFGHLGETVLAAGDILLLQADSAELQRTIEADRLEPVARRRRPGEDGRDQELIEAVVLPDALIQGSSPLSLDLRARYGISLIAAARQGRRFRRTPARCQPQRRRRPSARGRARPPARGAGRTRLPAAGRTQACGRAKTRRYACLAVHGRHPGGRLRPAADRRGLCRGRGPHAALRHRPSDRGL
jgi:di/tricarboxylate transporter